MCLVCLLLCSYAACPLSSPVSSLRAHPLVSFCFFPLVAVLAGLSPGTGLAAAASLSHSLSPPPPSVSLDTRPLCAAFPAELPLVSRRLSSLRPVSARASPVALISPSRVHFVCPSRPRLPSPVLLPPSASSTITTVSVLTRHRSARLNSRCRHLLPHRIPRFTAPRRACLVRWMLRRLHRPRPPLRPFRSDDLPPVSVSEVFPMSNVLHRGGLPRAAPSLPLPVVVSFIPP